MKDKLGSDRSGRTEDDSLQSNYLEKDDKIAEQMNRQFRMYLQKSKTWKMKLMMIPKVLSQMRDMYTFLPLLESAVTKNEQRKNLRLSDKIDRIVTNRWLALPIFAVVMFVVYYVSVTTVGAFLTDWTNDTLFGEWIIPGAQSFFESIGCADWLTGLIVDGIISGVGAVLGFRTTDVSTVYLPCILRVLWIHGACCIYHGQNLP